MFLKNFPFYFFIALCPILKAQQLPEHLWHGFVPAVQYCQDIEETYVEVKDDGKTFVGIPLCYSQGGYLQNDIVNMPFDSNYVNDRATVLAIYNVNGTLYRSIRLETDSTYRCYISSADTDDDGNIYIAGHMEGSCDFDPSINQYIINGADYGPSAPCLYPNVHYLAKYDSLGSFIWIRILHEDPQCSIGDWWPTVRIINNRIYYFANITKSLKVYYNTTQPVFQLPNNTPNCIDALGYSDGLSATIKYDLNGLPIDYLYFESPNCLARRFDIKAHGDTIGLLIETSNQNNNNYLNAHTSTGSYTINYSTSSINYKYLALLLNTDFSLLNKTLLPSISFGIDFNSNNLYVSGWSPYIRKYTLQQDTSVLTWSHSYSAEYAYSMYYSRGNLYAKCVNYAGVSENILKVSENDGSVKYVMPFNALLNSRFHVNNERIVLYGQTENPTSDSTNINPFYTPIYTPGFAGLVIARYNTKGEENALEEITDSLWGITLFPNPTSKTITINSAKQINNISFTNSFGQKIYSIEKPEFSATINIETWTNGLYFATVRDNNYHLKTYRFIVSH